MNSRTLLVLSWSLFILTNSKGILPVYGQPQILPIEDFALASDRTKALAELIPGTEEYFYLHALQHQNLLQLDRAQALLIEWKTKLGDSQRQANMQLRQAILSYDADPAKTLNFLREQLGIDLGHAAPAKNQAAALPSVLDNAQLNISALLESLIARDPSMSLIETDSLPMVLDRQLDANQLRAVLGRLQRIDTPNLVKRIAEELGLEGSRGFGWAPVHALLTLDQLNQIAKLRPELLGNETFVRASAARMAPAAGASLADANERRSYIERLRTFAAQLPASQNNFKALVLGNLLKLNLQQGNYDRKLFLEYLSLPRPAIYYIRRLTENHPVISLDYQLTPQIQLPPVGNDDLLVRRYLEQLFQSSDKTDDLAAYIESNYLQLVLAESKILYGQGDSTNWYSKLSSDAQRELRNRVELKFAPDNSSAYAVDQLVQLKVELKNVPQLLIKIYQINTLANYRNLGSAVRADLDLDGLVPNHELRREFNHPGDKRHSEVLALPLLEDRGVWIVDLIGGGQRSRALIEKGRLLGLQRVTSAGHIIQIVDEAGEPVSGAYVELGSQTFKPNDKSQIVIPFTEAATQRTAVLVHGEFASPLDLVHLPENYQLTANFHLDRQALVAGSKTKLLLQTKLTCNGQPTSIKLLEEAELTITAVDLDGSSTQQIVNKIELIDGQEFAHSLLVPQRLASINATLKGKVYNQAKDIREEIAATTFNLSCNQVLRTAQIADFYLQPTLEGYLLALRGRNGELISKTRVQIEAKLKQFAEVQKLVLATNENGQIILGQLEDVDWIRAQSEDVQPSQFALTNFWRRWPDQLNIGAKSKVKLTLGTDHATLNSFELTELRNDLPFRLLNEKLSIKENLLEIDDLPAGDFRLLDRGLSQSVLIRVSDLSSREYSGVGTFSVGKHRILPKDRFEPVSIRTAKLEDNRLRIHLNSADDATRVHIVAVPYSSNNRWSSIFDVTIPSSSIYGRSSTRAVYQDSLKIDEEYRYILDRQGITAYPGNMLPQPSLLIQPWERSVTENQRQEAAPGQMPSDMAASNAPAKKESARDRLAEGSLDVVGWKSFDFLRAPAVIIENLVPKEGNIEIPLKQMEGYSRIIISVLNATSVDSRQVILPTSPIAARDNRLDMAFSADQALAQTQKIQVIPGNQKSSLGDPRSRRIQIYGSIADLYQYYGSMLNDPNWDQFRFLTRWADLELAEKQQIYGEKSCHELNFFLYHKDPAFFASVVKPLIAQKLDKQLVDHWLIGNSLEKYLPLWYQNRLNTLERILLAQSVAGKFSGTQRWLNDYVIAHPIAPGSKQTSFGSALLSLSTVNGRVLEEELLSRYSLADAPSSGESLKEKMKDPKAVNDVEELDAEDKKAGGFGGRGLRLGRRSQNRFFQSLDKTREWAESHYYRVPLAQQNSALIIPNSFWSEFLNGGAKPFISTKLDEPCRNIHEALCALAVVDLPLTAKAPQVTTDENQLTVESVTPAIAFVESIESIQPAQNKPAILVGHELFASQPGVPPTEAKAIRDKTLLRGTAYRAIVVLSNPTDRLRHVHVLAQLPAGSMPLSASKFTRSTPIDLQPYSTQQLNYEFYFPVAGQFEHYGIQIAEDGEHLTRTDSNSLNVLDEPESVDQNSWSYVADWGTSEQVLEFLKTANLDQIDLQRIAFRMTDSKFFEQATDYLAAQGKFEPSLWGYAVMHNKLPQLHDLLQQRSDLTSRLGPAFTSKIVSIDPQMMFSYEHLDYRPLVVARSHQLGPKRTILNSGLFVQYHRLLELLSHQPQPTNDQKLQLCYYMLVQNRLAEAIRWFDSVDRNQLETQLQYDYFGSYISFYQGKFEQAEQLALKYLDYPVPRWKELFAQVHSQLAQRKATLEGQLFLNGPSEAMSAEQRILVGGRETSQGVTAANQPALELVRDGERVVLNVKNIDSVQIRYYLMDIELLFSRNPFVSQGSTALPAIQPNLTEQFEIGQSNSFELKLPEGIRNRNVLVEAYSSGLSRTQVITNNSMTLSLSETQGLLQLLKAKDHAQVGRAPVSAAYVKVYAQHHDGSTRFYKDGYTDLRGQFDYATLSTNDLDTVSRFAILVIHPDHGSVVRETTPPTR